MTMGLPPLRISRAENDLLFDEEGRSYIDLFSAHGTTWLGHADRDVADAIARQLGRVWVTGGIETDVSAQARALVEGFFPPTHHLAALYSTGMEAAEFALRVARVATGRSGAVGFARSMHGKSLATAYLGWDNRDDVRLPDLVRLPFVPDRSEREILDALAGVLADHPVCAVFVEPIQGCGGGHSASPPFYHEVARLCAERSALLVFDEILTGFHRTGGAFVFSDLGVVPDVVLIGKAMGGGFPVSGVVVDEKYPITPAMLPGSTYAGNPLAAAAVAATLTKLRALDLPGRVAAIERVIVTGFASLDEVGVVLRGKGALWVLELPAGWDVEAIVVNLYRRGVAVGYAGRHLRILPAAIIDPGRLASACAIVREELTRPGREGGHE
jgi:acetylornithine/succinyldiaminopimelate/putrescine aminotransferase